MKKRILLVGSVILLVFVVSAWAADVDGKWIAEREVKDGENILEFEISQQDLVPGPHEVSLKFRYQMRFTILPLWRISAFLEKIEIR